MPRESERISRLSDTSTTFITAAMTYEAMKKTGEATTAYEKAFRAEMDVVNACREEKSGLLVPHALSAGWCAWHARNPSLMKEVIDLIDTDFTETNKAIDDEVKKFRREYKKLSRSVEHGSKPAGDKAK